jgi:hypothetical protein
MVVFPFTARDCLDAFFNMNVEVLVLKPSCRDDDSILIIPVLFNVVRRIGCAYIAAAYRLEKVIEAIKSQEIGESVAKERAVAIAESPDLPPSDLTRDPVSASHMGNVGSRQIVSRGTAHTFWSILEVQL